jgi:hypothetical protein
MRPEQLKPRRTAVRWNEKEWDDLADLVHSMRRNSPDSITTLANRAQKQFPKERQRPGILTTAALQPLIERIQQKDRDLQVKAQKSDEYATKLSFFKNAPATREELLTSLSDDEIRGSFLPRLLQVVTPIDVIGAFKTEVVLDSVATGDLAAVLVKRLVTDWERPIQVSVQIPEQREQRPTPKPKINGTAKKVLIVGAKGDQPRHLREKVGSVADLIFIDTERLDRQSVPKSVDLVVLWSKFVSHQQREIILSVVEPRKVLEHFGGLVYLVRRIEELCSVGAAK